ncbi:FMN-binding protein [Tissierella sp. MSJ-40]|uniref:FMN-binding protein n=1 Tax=Tissierella simiarum TaxID=2841534 RepID=A0ABS6E9C0_9FIRM|nr:FMN-binding protein [Tissierella simiarum]
MEKKTVIVTVPLVLIGVLILVWIIISSTIVKRANQLVISNAELLEIHDGIYTREYIQSPVKTVVQVEVENHQISKIEILEHQNGLGQKAETIVDDVLNQQILNVDSITGETVSSKVILKAIENALSK